MIRQILISDAISISTENVFAVELMVSSVRFIKVIQDKKRLLTVLKRLLYLRSFAIG